MINWSELVTSVLGLDSCMGMGMMVLSRQPRYYCGNGI